MVGVVAKQIFPLGASRLAIGLMQGAFLWFLDRAMIEKQWPATDEALFTPLLTVAWFLPVIAIAGIGNLRTRTLTLWLLAALLLCLALGWYSIFRQVPMPLDRRLPASWFELNVFLVGLLFVLHALVAAADKDRRWIAGPAAYFEAAWKLAAQLAFAGLFVALLWGALFLGVKLFEMINIGSFAIVAKKSWLWIPITTLAASFAFHLIDRRFTEMQGAVKLLLGLVSWLLFIVAPIILAFLVALPFTGLAALWNTGQATLGLITASIVIVALINSHFQAGDFEPSRSRGLLYVRYAAALLLVPLFALAVFGLGLRVEQYGWTPSRIVAVGCLIVLGCYALGYSVAAIRSGLSLRGLATANVWAAIAAVAVSLALLSPVADPSRLFVTDQVRRLETGAVPADEFDYYTLRVEGAGYGWAALERLRGKQDGPGASEIAKGAKRALEP
jgi:hypothetical protein